MKSEDLKKEIIHAGRRAVEQDLEEEVINSGGQVDKTDTKQGFAERRSR